MPLVDQSAQASVRQLLQDRRINARLPLRLPLRMTRIGGQTGVYDATLLSRDISTIGVYFLSPKRLDPGTAVELEVALVDRPLEHGKVRLATVGQVVRTDITDTPGWHGLAIRFDEISFHYE